MIYASRKLPAHLFREAISDQNDWGHSSVPARDNGCLFVQEMLGDKLPTASLPLAACCISGLWNPLPSSNPDILQKWPSSFMMGTHYLFTHPSLPPLPRGCPLVQNTGIRQTQDQTEAPVAGVHTCANYIIPLLKKGTSLRTDARNKWRAICKALRSLGSDSS